MLVVSSSKTPRSFEKCLTNYLYKMDTGLYVGDVTYRVLEFLMEEIPKFVGSGHCQIYWKNAGNPRGFDVFEFSGDGDKNMVEIDGFLFRRDHTTH